MDTENLEKSGLTIFGYTLVFQQNTFYSSFSITQIISIKPPSGKYNYSASHTGLYVVSTPLSTMANVKNVPPCIEYSGKIGIVYPPWLIITKLKTSPSSIFSEYTSLRFVGLFQSAK